MSGTNNSPNRIVGSIDTPIPMSDSRARCKICGRLEEVTRIAILDDDCDPYAPFEAKKVLWVCQDHFESLCNSKEYYVRELPSEKLELGHSAREEVHDETGDYVTIYEDESDTEWFTAPEDLELNLKKER